MKNKFSERLKILREQQGMTHAEVAKKLGISVPTLKRWEQSKKAGLDVILKVCDVFDCTSDYILGTTDKIT